MRIMVMGTVIHVTLRTHSAWRIVKNVLHNRIWLWVSYSGVYVCAVLYVQHALHVLMVVVRVADV